MHIPAALSGHRVVENKACEAGRENGGWDKAGTGGEGLGVDLIRLYGILNKSAILTESIGLI